ncbi:calcium-binding protein [Octadecabacter antarcticus]|uniref:calcium-binding protein n=1 Tax=Octadecabacter antarcticus TaxID=1217908 RepID=UPI001181BDC1|nr:calcium-binding protein [Octadecabacter antarcticus]
MNWGVYAQAYNADGTAQGGEILVNSETADSQLLPQSAALSDGGWVITWQSAGQDDPSHWGIYAQAYNADGTAQGGETLVNTHTASLQIHPDITALSDGGWVITWQSAAQDNSDGNWGIYAQAYNDDGTAQGGETLVNTETASSQESPQITALSDGGWVITWESKYEGDPGNWGGSVYAQAYNEDGTAQGGETLVNTHTANAQQDPQIAALSDGGWVITWMSSGQDDPGDWGIYAQAYNEDGTAQGGETLVNTHTASSQESPQITALSDGGWVITWMSAGQDNPDGYWGIYAQAYNADGTARDEGEILVNAETASSQTHPDITALSDGGWVITWMSAGQDDSDGGVGVYSRTFEGLPAAGGDETIEGTAAADTITFTTLDTTVNAGEGANTITGTSGNNLINAGIGADTITVTSGNNTINAGGGANTITATTGNNTITLGDGANTVTATLGDNDITSGIGADTITVTSGANTINAGDGANTITATLGDNDITTGSGADTITVTSGANTINAGDGANTITATSGINTIVTGYGADTITTGGVDGGGNMITSLGGANVITSGAGNDTITTGDGDDMITSGGGNDVLHGGGGSNLLVGGEGADTFSVNDSIQGVDTVGDFEVGSDVIKVSGVKSLTFNDLFLSQEDSFAIIQAGDTTMRLQGVDFEDLDKDDFLGLI